MGKIVTLALGLTQQGLASKLKVSRNTVARRERDEMAIPGSCTSRLRLFSVRLLKPQQAPAKH
jgi:transcriptional regulator with XRE-family HTH domain